VAPLRQAPSTQAATASTASAPSAAPDKPAPRIVEATTGAAAPGTAAGGAPGKSVTIGGEDIKITLPENPAPAAPAPPETTASASTITLDVMKEEPAIRQTIDEYAQGETTLDVGLIQRAFPSLGAKTAELSKRFSEVQDQEVTFDVAEIKLDGNTAQVKGKETKIVTPKGGEQKTSTRRVTIALEKRERGWVITNLR
jgi:hypothetical protein